MTFVGKREKDEEENYYSHSSGGKSIFPERLSKPFARICRETRNSRDSKVVRQYFCFYSNVPSLCVFSAF